MRSFRGPYSSGLAALQAYYSIHGDLAIPRRYIVPSDSPEYPPEWKSVDLSSTVYDMHWWQTHVRNRPSRVAELNEIGFIWERLQPEWNLVLSAIISYSTLNHGSTLVPSSFIVPHGNSGYPKSTWGLKLGSCVHRIRSRQDFVHGKPDRVNQLNGLDFVWDAREQNFQKCVEALTHFGRLKGDGSKVLRVPSTFVIPRGDRSWPEELWGYPLGVKCNAIRQKALYIKNCPERKKQLQRLGFLFSGNSSLAWLEVVHAAAIYSKMHRRTLNVPSKFIIPAPPTDENGRLICQEEWPWPERLWGLPLGQRLRDVRLKGRYLVGKSASSRIAQLNALGFEWKPKRGRRKRSLGGNEELLLVDL